MKFDGKKKRNRAVGGLNGNVVLKRSKQERQLEETPAAEAPYTLDSPSTSTSTADDERKRSIERRIKESRKMAESIDKALCPVVKLYSSISATETECSKCHLEETPPADAPSTPSVPSTSEDEWNMRVAQQLDYAERLTESLHKKMSTIVEFHSYINTLERDVVGNL